MFTKKIIFAGLVVGLFLVTPVRAQTSPAAPPVQQTPQVNYNGQEPIDSDLDGLTDQAEIQVYKTDPNNPDTDGDGYFDGAEVLAGSNPLDKNSTPISISGQVQSVAVPTKSETPWAWYVSRAAGLVGFVLLYISIFLGLTIRLPFMRKYFSPLYAINGHRWIALQAVVMALIHGSALLFDKYLGFKLINVFVPFTAAYQTGFVALGIISFYLMVLLVASSYGRKYLTPKLWRGIHFLNIILYIFVIIHAYNLGTDMKIPLVRNIFVYANVALIWLMITNMYTRIRTNIERKNATT
jgi:hypothetical protein